MGRGSNVDATGRTKEGKGPGNKHVRLYYWLTSSPAWRSLTPLARAAYPEIAGLYNGRNNGSIGVSIRWLAGALGVAENTARKALDDLIDRGFLRVMRAADFNWKTGAAQGECRLFALTEFPNDLNHSEATKDFMRFGPPPEKKKQRAQKLRGAVSKSAPRLPKNNQKPVNAVSKSAPANAQNGGQAVSKSASLISYHATGESEAAISATTTDEKLASRLVNAGLTAEQAWNALLVLDPKKLVEIQGAEADGSLTTQALLNAVQKCAVSGGQ